MEVLGFENIRFDRVFLTEISISVSQNEHFVQNKEGQKCWPGVEDQERDAFDDWAVSLYSICSIVYCSFSMRPKLCYYKPDETEHVKGKLPSLPHLLQLWTLLRDDASVFTLFLMPILPNMVSLVA